MSVPRRMARFIFQNIMVVAALLTLGPGKALALDVTGLRMGTHPDKTRVVMDLSSKTIFRAFVLDNPVRLVIDMPGFEWRVGAMTKPPGTGIRDIRQGSLQKGISRVAIDLDYPVTIRNAFIMPATMSEPDRLVIDFTRANDKKFHETRSHVFGTLEVPDAAIINTSATSEVIAGNLGTPARATPPPAPAKPKTLKKPLIVIDPGHGGQDPGAVGVNGLKEKNITLAMARDLKKNLEDTGRYKVILTRDSDTFIKLSRRVSFARSKGADLFISLHADSINRSGVRGASIYTLSEKASDAEAEKLAARENGADQIAGIDLSHEDEEVASILVDLAMRDTMNQSKFFANSTLASLKSGGIRTLENPHRSAGFAVLKAPDIPSILIELGYMSNNQESSMLSKPEYRAQIARALSASIDRYFDAIQE